MGPIKVKGIKTFFYLIICTFYSLCFASSSDFVKSHMGEEYDVVLKTTPPGDFIEDGKLAQIYYIQSPLKTVGIVKEFKQSPSNLRDYHTELKAYERLKQMKHKPLNTPILLQSGSDATHLYLALSLAKGKSMNQWIQEAKKGHMSALLSGVKASGKALKSLHETHQQKQAVAPNSTLIKRLNAFIDDQQNKPTPGIDLETLRHAQKLLQTQPITHGYTHGDLHPGNVFFDVKTQEVTFIDLSTLSIGQSSCSLQPLAMDAMQYLLFLKAAAKAYGLSHRSLDQIESAFFEGYGSITLPQEELDLCAILAAIDLIDVYRVNTKNPQHSRRTQNQLYQLYASGLTTLKKESIA